MKKLFAICLSVLMLCGCTSNDKKVVTELGQTEFDGMKITFYENHTDFGSGMSSTYLYFTNDKDGVEHTTASPFIVSSDKSTKLYVDLMGYNEVFDEHDNVVPFVEEIEYEGGVIRIYHLDNNKKYYEKNVNLGDHTIFGAIESPTGMTITYSKEYKFSYDMLMEKVNTWEKIDTYEKYADYKEFKEFMKVEFNKYEINGFRNIIIFHKVELENGDWLIMVEPIQAIKKNYYLLTKEQVEDFKELLK